VALLLRGDLDRSPDRLDLVAFARAFVASRGDATT